MRKSASGAPAQRSWCGVSCNVCREGERASPASGLSRHVSQSPVVRVTCVASPASGLYLKARLSVAGRARNIRGIASERPVKARLSVAGRACNRHGVTYRGILRRAGVMRNSFDEARLAGERRRCGHPFRRCIICVTRPARPPPQQVGPAAARRRRCNMGVTAGVTAVRNGGRNGHERPAVDQAFRCSRGRRTLRHSGCPSA